MCKRRFLDIDILGTICQLSLGQERSGEKHRKILTVFDYVNALCPKELEDMDFHQNLPLSSVANALRLSTKFFENWFGSLCVIPITTKQTATKT